MYQYERKLIKACEILHPFHRNVITVIPDDAIAKVI